MTVQEQLMERVKAMPDDEAERWLRQLVEEQQAPLRFSQIINEYLEDVSEEELANLPTDIAENHDHYAYGLPKS